MKVVDFGNKIVYFNNDGQVHRDDGPAIIRKNGAWEEWYYRGVLHRDDGPAIIGPDGTEEYYVHGNRVE